jgi:hypothetical protein
MTRVELASASVTLRLRSWRAAGSGVVVLLCGAVVWLVLVGVVGAIDGASTATHRSAIQNVVMVVMVTLFLLVPPAWLIAFAGLCRRNVVVASSDEVAVVGRRTLRIPWSMISDVILVAPRRRARHRRTPALVLVSGSLVRIPRASSRVPARVIAELDAHRDPEMGALDRDIAMRVVREIHGRIPRSQTPPPESERSASDHASHAPPPLADDLPGPVAFQRRIRDLIPPNARLAGYGAIILGMGRLAMAVTNGQQRAGQPFDWGRFMLILLVALVSAELLIVGLSFFTMAELAIGTDWIAQRRHFHRRWRLLGRDEIVSVSRWSPRYIRRQARSSAGALVISSTTSSRALLISGPMLRAGAASALIAVLKDSPALLTSARELLQQQSIDASPAPPDPVVRAKRTFLGALSGSISYLVIAGIAVSIAVADGASWVIIPAGAAFLATTWAAIYRFREWRRIRGGGVDGDATGRGATLEAAILRIGRVASALTIILTSWAVHRALNAPPPGYSTAVLSHVVTPLPTWLASAGVPAGSNEPRYADQVLSTLWGLREHALSQLDPNELAMVDARSSEALATDVALVKLASVGQATGNRVPFEPEVTQVVITGSTASYPHTMLGEVNSTGPTAPRQSITLLVLSKAGPDQPWQISLTTNYTVTHGYNPFVFTSPASTATAAVDARQFPQELADYWRTWLIKHRAPASPFEAGPWTTTLGASLAQTTQDQTVNQGLNTVHIDYRPAYGPWMFPGPDGRPIVCSGILATLTSTAVGSQLMRQDPYRWNWGGLLAPGYYRIITDVGVHPSCIVEQAHDRLLVLGGDVQEVAETGTR